MSPLVTVAAFPSIDPPIIEENVAIPHDKSPTTSKFPLISTFVFVLVVG